MGLYPIDCPVCGKPFVWWSGNLPDQSCPECKDKYVRDDDKKPKETDEPEED